MKNALESVAIIRAVVALVGTLDVNQTRPALGALTTNRDGFGARAFAGNDAVLGDVAIVGAEIGVGNGGRATDQAYLLGGHRQTLRT